MLLQIGVLNQVFFEGKISFSLNQIDRTSNADWFNLDPGSEPEKEMKKKLSIDSPYALNIYSTGSDMLEWSVFPWAEKAGGDGDGCVIRFNTLPGGTLPY